MIGIPIEWVLSSMHSIKSLPTLSARPIILGKETLSGGDLNNKQLDEYVREESPLSAFYKALNTVWTLRKLKDGPDSVGALAALNWTFINTCLFSSGD